MSKYGWARFSGRSGGGSQGDTDAVIRSRQDWGAIAPDRKRARNLPDPLVLRTCIVYLSLDWIQPNSSASSDRSEDERRSDPICWNRGMHPNQEKLESRVHRAAGEALYRQHYVSAIDVLCGMGLLASSQVDAWRKGRVDFLERLIQGSQTKISTSLAIFRRWAMEKGLKPSETEYVRTTRGGKVGLQFSSSGDIGIEKSYRTHFVSPELSEKKQQRLQEKLNKAPNPVVFDNLRESRCSECGAEIEKGAFLFMEKEQPLCLACARLDDLEFLPSGEAALTRRASRYSERVAVVVRFSRSRKRYERQGVLVEASGLEKAERECLEDADERALERARGAEQRRKQDVELAARMTRQIAILFPGCPAGEVAAIAAHTARRGSGRIGRTEAGRNLEESALTLAVVAAIRHNRTRYDELLSAGVDRVAARERIAFQVEEILSRWRNPFTAG